MYIYGILGTTEWKNSISSTSGRDWIFAKSSRCDIWRQSTLLWNSQNLECWATFPNREILATMFWPPGQNASGKIDQTSPAGYTHRNAVQKPTKRQVAWLHARPCLFPSWYGARGAIRGVENLELFRDLLGLLPLQPSRQETRMWKWMRKPQQMYTRYRVPFHQNY